MQFFIYPRRASNTFPADVRFLWISITDPDMLHLETPTHFEENLIARLNLTFWDAETANDLPGGFWDAENEPPRLPLPETELFQPGHAKLILNFIDWHLSRDPLAIVVNCNGGLSRSPAVAAALAHCFGLPETEDLIWTQTCPNNRVYSMLVSEARKRV